MRIIPHIKWNIVSLANSDSTTIIVVSKDADVVILLLFYMRYFILYGLNELWIQLFKLD